MLAEVAGEGVDSCLVWGSCCLFSPGQGWHFPVLVAHLMELVLLWEQLCLAGITREGLMSQHHQSSLFFSLALRTEVFLCLD